MSWTTHDLLPRDQRRYRTYQDAHQAMNAALGSVLTAFGYQLAPFGSGGAWLVAGAAAGERGPGSDRARHSPGDREPATGLP